MNNSSLNSVKNTVLSSKPSTTIRLLLVAFFVLAQTVVFAQTVGDYRSNANGNWTTLSSWQYYNGSNWVTPLGTSPQGYPGEFAGTGTVTIRNNNTITLTSSITNLFTKLIIGDGVSSSGVFAVGANIANFNTLDIIINPTGNMNFTGQNELRLPANSGIKINARVKLTQLVPVPVQTILPFILEGSNLECVKEMGMPSTLLLSLILLEGRCFLHHPQTRLFAKEIV